MGVIINITSSPDIGLEEITIASEMISDMVDSSMRILFGVLLLMKAWKMK